MRRLALFLAATLFLGALARDRFDGWIAATQIPPLSGETSVEVTGRNGEMLRAYTVADGRWRLATTLDQVDPAFVAMLIAYEDKRFYSHGGVDGRAMARAGWQLVTNGHVVSGGSTLTMQLARLLEDGSTGRIAGKLRQIRLALALERRLTKDQILTLYLNRAPYGGNLEGLRSATRAYFGKDPRRLTTAEAALLVALPQSPETRRPDRFSRIAEAARARVLNRLRGTALGAADAQVALRAAIPSQRRALPALAPHLSDRAVAERPASGQHQLTVDGQLQRKLEALAQEAVEGKGDNLSVAILAVDHQNGEVLASVGSAAQRNDQRRGFVDMTRALRSPGSTLKPLVYGLAFDAGLAHPETLIEDRPTAFGTYRPQNFDGVFRGTLRVREALQQSLNIPVVTLTEALGPARLMAYLERSGARPVLPQGGAPGLAVALGGVGMTLEDLVQLYAAIGRGGAPVALNWRMGEAGQNPAQRVLSAKAAWQVMDILRGLPPPPNAPRSGLAYKTGTSYGNRDAWAIGFDGRHVIGVWMGRADGTPVPGAFGGDLAAPILFQAFGRLKPALAPFPPPPADTLIVENARLPAPLQRFTGRNALFKTPADAPSIIFPPDGSRIELSEGALFASVRQGAAPFTWLINGAPAAVGVRPRQIAIPGIGAGYTTLSVIDARGRAARATVFVTPAQ